MGAGCPTHFHQKNMTEEFQYRLLTATLGDLPQLGEMERICFPLDAWPLVEQITALILPGMVRIKADYYGKMIGFVGGDVKPSLGVGWITTLAVLPSYRRMGIGKALLEACEREMHMPYVKLSVRRSNIQAQVLYFENGYRQKDVWRNYYDGGEDALVLEKQLAQYGNVGLL